MDFSFARSLAFPCSWFLYLLRPPPPPREPREPILEEPRELLARAELPFIPPPLIPRDPPERDVLWLPTRSPPPPPRFPPRSPAPPPRSPRSPRLSPTPPRLSPIPPRLPWPRFWRAFAWRSATDDPRVVPPNLFAVCRSE